MMTWQLSEWSDSFCKNGVRRNVTKKTVPEPLIVITRENTSLNIFKLFCFYLSNFPPQTHGSIKRSGSFARQTSTKASEDRRSLATDPVHSFPLRCRFVDSRGPDQMFKLNIINNNRKRRRTTRNSSLNFKNSPPSFHEVFASCKSISVRICNRICNNTQRISHS